MVKFYRVLLCVSVSKFILKCHTLVIHNWVYIFHRVLLDPYSDVLRSEECQTKKLLANML